jgi:hypothetical protein
MSNRYHDFFIESDEGKAYIRVLNKLIDQNHRKAEQSPELARDFTQRAKGIREALDQATSMATDIKKPGQEPEEEPLA